MTGLVLAGRGDAGTPQLVLLGVLAGATVPQIGPLARSRSVALARGSGADDRVTGAVLSVEGTLDEVSFVLGPALVGVADALARPAAALLTAAALPAVCGTAFALDPTAAGTAGTAATAPSRAKPRLSGAVHGLRVAMVLQGAVFGASQAGTTALTDRLGQPDRRPWSMRPWE